jgi:hypothetical protein
MLAQPKKQAEERIPEYSEDGVDVSLIRWLLSLTPLERLQVLESNLNALARIRAFRSGR